MTGKRTTGRLGARGEDSQGERLRSVRVAALLCKKGGLGARIVCGWGVLNFEECRGLQLDLLGVRGVTPDFKNWISINCGI